MRTTASLPFRLPSNRPSFSAWCHQFLTAHRSTLAVSFVLACVLGTATAGASQQTSIRGKKSDVKVVSAADQDQIQAALERARGFKASTYPEDTPQDGQWFKREEGGFFVTRIGKNLRSIYKRLPYNEIRFQHGLALKLVEETETDLFVIMPRAKLYRDRSSEGSAEVQPKADNKSETPTHAVPAGTAEPNPESERHTDHGDESLVATSKVQITASGFDRGLPRSGQWRNALAVADMNGDGLMDIIHPPARKSNGRPHIFIGDGKGNWRDTRLRIRGKRLDYGDVAVADFDKDGHLDMAFAMHLLGTTITYGRGQLSFEERADGFDRPTWAKPNSKFGKRAPWSSRAILAIDVDQDGDEDLLAIGEGADGLGARRIAEEVERVFSEGLTLYLNRGSEPWLPFRFKALPAGGHRLAAGNFDADPAPEFVVAWAAANGRRMLLDLDFSEPLQPKLSSSVPTSLDDGHSTFIKAVAAGDLIPGGVDEFIVGRIVRIGNEWEGRVELHAREDGRADGPWKAFTLAYWPGKEQVSDIDVGDFDGDGVLDIVLGTSAARVLAMRGTGDGHFQIATESLWKPQYNCTAFSVALEDLDGDGADEVLTGFAGETTNIPGLETIQGCPNRGRISVWHIDGLKQKPNQDGAALPAIDGNLRLRGGKLLSEANETEKGKP